MTKSNIKNIKDKKKRVYKKNQKSSNTTDDKVNDNIELEELKREEQVQEESIEEKVQEPTIEEAPIQETSVQEEPVQEEPVKEEPVKEEPVKEESVKEESVKEEPLQEEPVQEQPLQEEPVQEEPVQEQPVQEEPVQEEPVQEEPLQEEPVQEEPVQEDKKYELNEMEILNILENNETIKYNLNDLKYIFFNIKEAVLLIQIINGEIKYIEKKGNESRNQSAIDLLIKANNYKQLPNIQFILFTNDYLDNKQHSIYKFVLTYCKNMYYNTTLFPNFNFNHWLEAKIGNYEDVYNQLIQNKIEWDNKKDIVFWSGANTNIIRKKVNEGYIKHLSKRNIENNEFQEYIINLINRNNLNMKYYTIDEHSEFKYLLNMNGYSYAGRFNYLFLSGSCVIVLKNQDKNQDWEEFFYKDFIAGEDYIEILYNDNDLDTNIIDRINDAIKNSNGKEIAERCFKKAVKVFKMNNIYEYINTSLTELSSYSDTQITLDKTVFYTPSNINYYFEDRIKVKDSNLFQFSFQGKEAEFLIKGNTIDIISIKITENDTNIYFNNELILNKYTPFLVNEGKSQNYDILIENDELQIIVDNKYLLVKCTVPMIGYIIKSVDIKTEKYGGWWIV